MITIANEAQQIKETNYWQSETNTLGIFLLTGNAGAWRLLVPDCQSYVLEETKTCRYVEFERCKVGGLNAIRMWFEDGTPTPFMLQISEEQADRTPRFTNESSPLLIYTREGLVQRHRVRKVR